jgi:RNA polymerase sigma factor (sigma-70 family)
MVPVWDADETGPKRNRLAGASKRTRPLVRVVDVIKVGGLTTARDQPDGVTFDELYRREFRALVALAYGLCGSRSAAEELVQEAFLAAHRRWERIGAYDDPSAWLRRVVVNQSLSAVRRRVAEARAMARLGGRRVLPDTLPERDEAVWRAVRALPDRQAQAVALYYVDDQSVAEIAEILRCAEGTVKAHLHKARQSLARVLAPGVDHCERREADR